MLQKIRRAGWLAGALLLGVAPLLAQSEAEKPFFAQTASDSRTSKPLSPDSPTTLTATPEEGDVEPVNHPSIRIDLPYSKREFARDLLLDQLAVWQSPFSADKKDLGWIIPVGLGTAALMPFDRRISESVPDSLEGPSLKFSMAGGPASIATAAAIFGIGHFAGKPHLRETGMLGMRATASAWLTVKGIKSATNRERPKRDGVEQQGDFWAGGKSFPSGHSAETWALATVISHQYRDNPWIRFGSYAFAAGISASRVTGQKHFPTDVIIGAVIGHLIGRHVVRRWRNRSQVPIFRGAASQP